MRSTVWTIAGSDSSGGAGVACDLKTLENFGVHGAFAVTANTAQCKNGLLSLGEVSESDLTSQLQALNSFSPSAIKVGLCGKLDFGKLPVAIPLIWDPVGSTSLGGNFPLSTCDVFDSLAKVALFTPNLAEVQSVLKTKLTNPFQVEEAAKKFFELGAQAVLIKGGHSDGAFASDFFLNKHQSFWLHQARQSSAVRGTGCALSSAIAAGLAKGLALIEAVILAKTYVSRGIRRANQADGMQTLFHGNLDFEEEDFPWLGEDPAGLRLFFPRCQLSRFYPIVDSADWVERLIKLGVRTIQLRVKDKTGLALEREIIQAVSVAQKNETQLFINDYWDLALKYSAYGVHLGQEDLLSASLGEIAKSGMRLGVSTHNYEELARAKNLNPSYLALGPVFPTSLKKMGFGPQGFSKVAEWKRLAGCPLVAIGGITLATANSVLRAGADSVAVITDLFQSTDPGAKAREYLSFLSNPELPMSKIGDSDEVE